MDKQAEIQRIKNKITVAKWDMIPPDLVGDILDAAGYFDLLEAAERVGFICRAAKANEVKIPHTHGCFRELSEALKKAGVDL